MNLLELFESYFTEEDILEAIEECKKFQEKKTDNIHFDELFEIYDPIDTEYRKKIQSDTETKDIAYMVMCDGESLE